MNAAGRNLFPGHGKNGKGSAPRHKLTDEWRANYDSIDWSGVVKDNPLPTRQGRAVYVYGGCSQVSPSIIFDFPPPFSFVNPYE